MKTTVDECSLCGKINEVKVIKVSPVGFRRFFGKVTIKICQSCISKLLRGCYKEL